MQVARKFTGQVEQKKIVEEIGLTDLFMYLVSHLHTGLVSDCVRSYI